jgi:hypothetical protein
MPILNRRGFCATSARTLFSLLTTVLTTSCEQYECPTQAPIPGPYVEVVVTDASTGQAAADSVRGYLQNGDYLDKLVVCGVNDNGVAILLCGGFKLSGTYTIVLEKAGYRRWTLHGVRVPLGRCGVLDVARVTAELERL